MGRGRLLWHLPLYRRPFVEEARPRTKSYPAAGEGWAFADCVQIAGSAPLWHAGAMQSEPADDIDALRAERDQLLKALTQTRGSVAWVISDILRLQHYDSTLPERVALWLETSILPRLRQAAGWVPDGNS
jgi:hypothetical protein